MSDNSDPRWTAEPVDNSDLEWTRKRLLEAQEEATREATRADKAEAAIEEVRQWIANINDELEYNMRNLASILEHYGYPAKEEK